MVWGRIGDSGRAHQVAKKLIPPPPPCRRDRWLAVLGGVLEKVTEELRPLTSF